MKVCYTSKALAQLDEIFAFIEAENPAAALSVMKRIRRSIEQLAKFPYRCRASELPGVRVLSIVRFPYLVFY